MSRGFFTQRQAPIELPFPPVDVRYLLIVHACIARAFAMMRARGDDLAHTAENAITNELEQILRNDLADARGDVYLDPDFFVLVTRGSAVENHNAEKIGKQPDLVFHLRRPEVLGDKRQDALFAECKPIDNNHSLGGHYCAVGKSTSGVERFVVGDYAWAMQEALMVGYVRHGFAVEPHLTRALTAPAKRQGLGNPTKPTQVQSLCSDEPRLYRTRHERAFVWRNGRKATPIEVYHSWHDCG